MTFRRQLLACGAALCLMAWVSTLVVAQTPAGQGQGGTAAQGGRDGAPAAAPAGGPGRGNFVPEPVPPPQNFATSTEHYDYLFRLHKGGTRHTYETVPKWEGLWSAAGNTSTGLFVKGGGGGAGWARGRDHSRRAHAGLRGGLQDAPFSGRGIRPAHRLRAGRLSALAARALRPRVRQHAVAVVVGRTTSATTRGASTSTRSTRTSTARTRRRETASASGSTTCSSSTPSTSTRTTTSAASRRRAISSRASRCGA